MALASLEERIPPRVVFGVAVGTLAGFSALAIVRPLASGVFFAPRPHATGYAYTWLVLALFVPYGFALWVLRRVPHPSIRAVIVAAGIVTVPLMVAPLLQSQDLYQYLFYAKMQLVHGANPYIVDPDTFARDPWFAYVGWHEQLSVYGPLWSLAMQGVVAAAFGLACAVPESPLAPSDAVFTGSCLATVGGPGLLGPSRRPPRATVHPSSSSR